MIRAECKFNGVGQGLFYSASISTSGGRKSNFVYDCGTNYEKDKSLLIGKIDSSFSDDTIDALFISHYHKDHISGVKHLSETYHIKNVFLPAFTEEELWLLCLKYDVKRGDELYDFYSNPIDFFAGECRVYVVEGEEDDTPNNEREFQGDRIGYANNNDITDGIIIETMNGIIDTSKKGKDYVRCSSESVKIYNRCWEFKIYQDQNKAQCHEIKEEIRKEYRLKFGEDFPENSIESLIDTRRGKLCKDIYDKVEGKINQSSLVLCHYPSDSDAFVSWDNGEYCRRRYCCKCYCHKCVLAKGRVATLLTGDINLDKLSKKNRFTKYINKVLPQIGFFQMPHHGSSHNMSENTIDSLPLNYTNMICSYGIGNKYRHPDPYLLHQLERLCNSIIHVNNNEDYFYTIKGNCR